MPPMNSKWITAWSRFAQQVCCDAQLWLLGVLLLQLFRIVLIVAFRDYLSNDIRWTELALALWTGFRFDAQTAAWFAALSFLASLGCLFGDASSFANRLRAISRSLLIVAVVIVGGVDLGYFSEYRDQFNHFLFGAVYDDFRAVLVTISKQYPVIKSLLLGAGVFAVLWSLSCRMTARSWLRSDQVAWLAVRPWRRLMLLICCLLLCGVTLRGSVGRRPIQRKDAATSRDAVLNKMVLNPFSALRYAVTEKMKLNSGAGLEIFLADRDVRRAVQSFASTSDPVADVDAALRRVAQGPKGNPPRHVFFILMESYDGWATLERYQSLGLSERLMDLGRRGLFTRKFLSASSGTMTSFAAILTGLAEAGIVTNYQPLARRPFPSSINPIVQRLGLRTRMFLGGYFSWQRSDAFCLEQGFQELYAAPHMTQSHKSNEWGPDDRDLFDFVLRATDPEKPSFNVIMTSTYHPPFSVDVYGRGFPHKTVPPDLAGVFQADADYLRVLGHLWYADQMLGEFVAAAERKYPDALFVITGDHTSRQFLNKHPTLFEEMAVPFVMYGPSVLRDVPVPPDLVGSHHDIMPTVIELLAPRGFEYHAVGHDLLDPNRRPIGFGRHHIISRDFIASRLPEKECQSLNGSYFTEAPAELSKLQAEYQMLLGVAWWRICRGTELPDSPMTSVSRTAELK